MLSETASEAGISRESNWRSGLNLERSQKESPDANMPSCKFLIDSHCHYWQSSVTQGSGELPDLTGCWPLNFVRPITDV